MTETERYWNRINEAAQKLAAFHHVEAPAGVQTATGNVWQREESRRSALNAFLPDIKKPAFSKEVPLWVIANQMDAYALETMAIEEEDLEEETEGEEDDGS